MTKEDKEIRDRSSSRGSDSDELVVVTLLRRHGLSSKDILSVLDVLDEVCTYCMDGYRPCNCWNDD